MQNTVMTIDLDALEKLARAATPGPWVRDDAKGRCYIEQASSELDVAVVSKAQTTSETQANASFIAAANPAAVLELIRMARSQSVPDEWRAHLAMLPERLYDDAETHDCAGNNSTAADRRARAYEVEQMLAAPTPPVIPKEATRNRAATEPGGVQCDKCGCIFIGEEWHSLCGACFPGAAPRAERTEPTSSADSAGVSDTNRLDFMLQNDAFTTSGKTDSGGICYQLLAQTEDEDYIILSGKDAFFRTEREAIDAAISRQGDKG